MLKNFNELLFILFVAIILRLNIYFVIKCEIILIKRIIIILIIICAKCIEYFMLKYME